MNRMVLITGASGGIGRELAKLFAAGGYDLILVARSEARLNALKATLEKQNNVRAWVIPADLAQKDAARAVYDEVRRLGLCVDVLVNNAGFGDSGSYLRCDWDRQYEMVQLNIVALMQMTKLLLPEMVQNKNGKILNVASVAAFAPGPYMATYYASKSFVLSFSTALARELAGSGVTVTALCPGPTETGWAKTAGEGAVALFSSMRVASAAQVARYAYRKLMRGKGVAVPGALNKLMDVGTRLLPRGAVSAVVARMQGPR